MTVSDTGSLGAGPGSRRAGFEETPSGGGIQGGVPGQAGVLLAGEEEGRPPSSY